MLLQLWGSYIQGGHTRGLARPLNNQISKNCMFGSYKGRLARPSIFRSVKKCIFSSYSVNPRSWDRTKHEKFLIIVSHFFIPADKYCKLHLFKSAFKARRFITKALKVEFLNLYIQASMAKSILPSKYLTTRDLPCLHYWGQLRAAAPGNPFPRKCPFTRVYISPILLFSPAVVGVY